MNRTSLPAETPRKALPDMIQGLMMLYAQKRVCSSLSVDELQPIQLATRSIMPHGLQIWPAQQLHAWAACKEGQSRLRSTLQT